MTRTRFEHLLTVACLALLVTGVGCDSTGDDPFPRLPEMEAPDEDGGGGSGGEGGFIEDAGPDEGPGGSGGAVDMGDLDGGDPDEGAGGAGGAIDMGPDEGAGGAGGMIPPSPPDCTGVEFRPCETVAGAGGATLIRGTIVSGDRLICDGEVLVDRASKRVECVGEDCSDDPLAADASVICADIVMPGIIDPHNHMSYNTLPPWRSDRLFQNRDEWRPIINGEMYGARPSGGDPVAARFNEVRLLLAGTTAVHKAEDTDSSHDLVRNLDRGEDAHHLPYEDFDFYECVFPFNNSCSGAPDYRAGNRIPARTYAAHVAEGIDPGSRNEFVRFDEEGHLGDKTSVIHCVACEGPELSRMRAEGAHLVWSPQSNLALYGETTHVPTALNMGLTVALGPDWTPSGTMNQLAEMKCAEHVGATYYDGMVDAKRVVRMVTDHAAVAMGVEDLIGRLEPGLFADVLVLGDGALDRVHPHEAIVAAQNPDVRAVFVGGEALYGDPDALTPGNQRNDLCEPLDLCGMAKTICLRTEAGEGDVARRDDWPRFDLAQMAAYLQGEIDENRPQDLPPELEYVYQLYPAFECTSTFACDMGNSRVSGVPTELDLDGDDVPDDVDNCPAVFNFGQGDLDADGAGDACDVCPWAVEVDPCPLPDANDVDADLVPDTDDNCPGASNPDQLDTDEDGQGDVCDYCPEHPDGDGQGCPATIPAIKRGELPLLQAVEVSGVVTAVVPDTAPGSQPGSFFMETAERDDPDAGHQGLYLYLGERAEGVEIPAVGDAITVVGQVNDFFGQIQLFEVTRLDVEGPGPALPPPIEGTPAELTARGAELESQRVCVRGVRVTDTAPEPGPGDREPFNEFVVADDAGDIRINDLLHLVDPPPDLGDRFGGVCGVLRFGNDAYKIEPRGPDDLIPGPPVVEAIEPLLSFVRVGAAAVPAGGQREPLTLHLSRPAPAEGAPFELIVDPPEGLRFEGPAMVPADAETVELTFVAEVPGDYTISALTPDQDEGEAATALVRALAVDATPAEIRIEPDALAMVVGDVYELDVLLDVPAPPDYLIELSAEPAGVVQLSDVEVELNGGEARVPITVTALAAGEVTLTARAGELEAEAAIVVIDVPPAPRITEVNYDMAGDETLEFVEIHNPGIAPMPLAGVTLELVNGNSGSPYDSYPLDGAGEVPPGGFLVVGDPGVGALLPPEALFIGWQSAGGEHDIQNGNPDGVRLLGPEGRIDGVVYSSGTMPDVTDEPTAPDDPNDAAGESIQRCPMPDGPWVLLPMSPGLPSDCPPPEDAAAE